MEFFPHTKTYVRFILSQFFSLGKFFVPKYEEIGYND